MTAFCVSYSFSPPTGWHAPSQSSHIFRATCTPCVSFTLRRPSPLFHVGATPSHHFKRACCSSSVDSLNSSPRMSGISITSSPKKLAVLVSGSGRSLENICERIDRGALTGCQVSLVIASKSTAGAIQKAERFGISTRVLRFKDFEKSIGLFSDAISSVLDEFGVDLVILAGWMHFYHIPPRYEGKVINIHPSLIPAFCGKGYYGHYVHQAVIDFGAKITGCTVHFADNKYDHGPIILQNAVAVLESDTTDDLAVRVFESEKEALPKAVQLFVDGKLSTKGRHVHILPEPASTDA